MSYTRGTRCIIAQLFNLSRDFLLFLTNSFLF